MKKILFLMTMLSICTIGMAQNNWKVQATNGKLVDVPKVTVISTANATATHVDSIVIADNTAGIITVWGVGAATTGKSIAGGLAYRYSKASGTLTIATADTLCAVTADASLSGGLFALAATASNNAQLKATGKASTAIRWRFTVLQHPN
jgi:hypothetical protein